MTISKCYNNNKDFINNNINNWTINALKRYHTICTLCVQRFVCAISLHTDLTVSLSFSVRLTRTLVFNCLQLSSIRWLLLHLLRSAAAAATATVRAKNIWPVKALKLFCLYYEQSSKTRSDPVRYVVDESVKLWRQILETGYNEEIKYTHTQTVAHSHTQWKSQQRVQTVDEVFFYYFFLYLS